MLGGGGDATVLTAPGVPNAAILASGVTASGGPAAAATRIAAEYGGLGGGGGGAGSPHEHMRAYSVHAGVNLWGGGGGKR